MNCLRKERFPLIDVETPELLGIRDCGSTSHKKLASFLISHTSKFVRERPPEVLRRALEHRQFLIIENQQSDIVGASGWFQFGGESNGLDAYELGNTIIAAQARGCGLHKILLAIRLMQICVISSGRGFIFTIVKKANEHSLRSVHRAGFAEWSSPPSPIIQSRADELRIIEQDGAEAAWYLFDNKHVSTIARHYIEARQMLSVSRRDGQEIPLQISHGFLDLPVVHEGIMQIARD